MASAPKVIRNPVTGEVMRFEVTTEESGGAVMRWEHLLPAGAQGPPLHVHPQQEERFEVLSGTARLRVGRATQRAGPGAVVVVPPCAGHDFANVGNDDLRLRIEVRPALRMEAMFENLFALARAGRVSPRGFPNVIDAALIAHAASGVAYSARAPVALQRMGIAGLVAFARLIGRRLPEGT